MISTQMSNANFENAAGTKNENEAGPTASSAFLLINLMHDIFEIRFLHVNIVDFAKRLQQT